MPAATMVDSWRVKSTMSSALTCGRGSCAAKRLANVKPPPASAFTERIVSDCFRSCEIASPSEAALTTPLTGEPCAFLAVYLNFCI